MPKRKKSPGRRARAEAKRRNHISPERRAMLAGPVGVVERMELDALTPGVWLPRVRSNPNLSAETKAYAEQLAAQWREQGHLPDELFQTEGTELNEL